MRREDFLNNLRAVDAGADLDPEMLKGIYDRIKASEFRAGSDHVTQVNKVEEMISGKSGKNFKSLADPHRRLVCFCRLTEVIDVNKKEKKAGAHQRGVFLFNDLMVITKTINGKKKTIHQYRSTIPLNDVRVNVFCTNDYQFGIQLQDRLSGKIVSTFNARSDSDQQKLVSDVQEAVAETVEMEKAKMFLNQESQCPGESFC